MGGGFFAQEGISYYSSSPAFSHVKAYIGDKTVREKLIDRNVNRLFSYELGRLFVQLGRWIVRLMKI